MNNPEEPISQPAPETRPGKGRRILFASFVIAGAMGILAFQKIRWATLNRSTASFNSCINNLRQLDGAKEQWALENKKQPSDTVRLEDLLPYLKGSVLPTCQHYNPFFEHTGTYAVSTVGTPPTCRCPGHTL